MTTKRKQPSGASKRRKAGLHGVLLGVTPLQHFRLQSAAALEGRSLSKFLVYHALQAAQEVIDRQDERKRRSSK